jgi:hypothetical protein
VRVAGDRDLYRFRVDPPVLLGPGEGIVAEVARRELQIAHPPLP